MNNNKKNTPKVVLLPAEIGSTISQKRKELGLSQKEAAVMCNVGTRFLSDLENGKPSIQMGKALQVLRAFGLLLILKEKTFNNE